MKRKLFKAATAAFLLSLCAAPRASAQQEEWGTKLSPAQGTQQEPRREMPQPQQSTSAASAGRTNADETFELNIAERRITERDFAAMTSVEAGEESARGLRLRVGVEVGASEIDVLLLGVRGRVRFRATLERVLERLNARRPSDAAP